MSCFEVATWIPCPPGGHGQVHPLKLRFQWGQGSTHRTKTSYNLIIFTITDVFLEFHTLEGGQVLSFVLTMLLTHRTKIIVE